MDEQEQIFSMALTRLRHISPQLGIELYRQLGGGRAIYDHRNHIGDVVADPSPKLQEALKDWDEPLRRAEHEMDFCLRHGIKVLCHGEEGYPRRLENCSDPPIVLYYKGSADLNPRKVINIVGTRHSTSYGIDTIRKLMASMAALCPQVLVVSGLAYGVDINAHRQALLNGYETIGVLAHGLDTIYPSLHRATAREMTSHGGLLTEYMTRTNADKLNFIRRNRIVAGMSDACILIESASRGGGLITARIAQSYSREVFALPGRITDDYSAGCNQLILDNVAAPLLSAEQLLKTLGWDDEVRREAALARGIERSLWPMLSDEQALIARQLDEWGDLTIDILSAKTGFSASRLAALLFEMEMEGVVRPLAGGIYHLLKP